MPLSWNEIRHRAIAFSRDWTHAHRCHAREGGGPASSLPNVESNASSTGFFCLFVQDTGIFERESLKLYLLNRTAHDGSDRGLHLRGNRHLTGDNISRKCVSIIFANHICATNTSFSLNSIKPSL